MKKREEKNPFKGKYTVKEKVGNKLKTHLHGSVHSGGTTLDYRREAHV